MAQNVYMTPDEICGFVIGSVCGAPFNPLHDWEVTFPPIPKPPIKPMNIHQVSSFSKSVAQFRLRYFFIGNPTLRNLTSEWDENYSSLCSLKIIDIF